MLPAFLTTSVRKTVTAETREIDVAGRTLPLSIRPLATATRMTLRIEPGGQALKLTVPRHVRPADVDDFIARHHGWLLTRLAKFPRRPEISEGRYIRILDVPHRIALSGKLRGLPEIRQEDDEAVLVISGEAAHLKRRVRDYLKERARQTVEPIARAHARTSGKTIASLSFKDTKSRWGSCSHDGHLCFSWRIVMAPPLVVDYLCAHEVAHLTEMNHSDRFWALCERLCPDTDNAKRWLKRNGSVLHALDFG